MGWFNKKRYVTEGAVNTSYSLLKKDVATLMQWIHFLNHNHSHLKGKHESHVFSNESRHSELHSHMQELKSENAILKDRMMQMLDYMKLVHGEVKQLHEEVHTVPALPEPIEDNWEETVEEPEKMPEIHATGLTDAEKKVVAILCDSPEALTYAELSTLIGISYGTIKNRVMKLKKKGITLEFSTDNNGERRFFLPQVEKLRVTGR